MLGKAIPLSKIERQGITGITPEDIRAAQATGSHWKLVGSLENMPTGIKAAVRPVCLPASHPLARVSGVTNAIVYTTDLLGEVTMLGPGAGRLQTGYAVLQDLFHIYD